MRHKTLSPDTASDEALLARARQGCEQSFTHLYRRHQAKVYRYALQMCGNGSAAEEVTQEVFMALVSELERYDASRGSLLPYLMGVARNQTYRWLRRQQPYLPLEPLDEEPAVEVAATGNLLSDLTQKETMDELRRAIASLPPAYREVIHLCELEELDYAQAAVALGCAIGTVRSRLHRARALLLEKLKGDRRPAGSLRCSQ